MEVQTSSLLCLCNRGVACVVFGSLCNHGVQTSLLLSLCAAMEMQKLNAYVRTKRRLIAVNERWSQFQTFYLCCQVVVTTGQGQRLTARVHTFHLHSSILLRYYVVIPVKRKPSCKAKDDFHLTQLFRVYLILKILLRLSVVLIINGCVRLQYCCRMRGTLEKCDT